MLRSNYFLQKGLSSILSLIFFLSAVQLVKAQTWQPLGPDDNNWPSFYGISDVAFDANNVPYILTQDATGKALVRKYAGSNWIDVGTSGFSAGKVTFGSIAIDGNGFLYVAYRDVASGNKATVKKYDGSNWEDVGSPGFSAGSANNTKIATDGNNVPYIVYREGDFSGTMRVKKYDGINWVDVGTPGLALGSINNAAIAIDKNNIPYIAFKRDIGGGAIKKYDGNNWTDVGATIPNVYSGGISLAIDKDNIPYIAYCGPNAGNAAIVKKYSGNNWVNVGSPGLFGGSSTGEVFITIDGNGIPYIEYMDENIRRSIVKKYIGGNWVTIGTPFFSNASSWQHLTIKIDGNGNVYSTANDWSNSSSNLMGLKKFNGINWTDVGTPGFSADRASYLSLDIDAEGVPYVFYADRLNNDKAAVKKYNGSSWVDVVIPGTIANNIIDRTALKINKDGEMYIAYNDRNYGNKLTVIKFNGVSWLTVGNPGFSLGGADYISLAFDTAGIPYVAFANVPGGAGGYLVVKKFNGTSWENVGGSGEFAAYTSITISSAGTPYVAYRGTNNNAVVKKFDGVGWVDAGTIGFSTSSSLSYSVFMSIDGNDTPYLAYSDASNADKATVKKYDGNNWVNVGSPGFSAGAINNCTIKINTAGIPFVSYKDAGRDNKAVLKRFDGSNWVDVGNPVSNGPANFSSLAITRSGIPVIAYSNSFAFAKAFIEPLNLSVLKAVKTPEATVKLTWDTYDERGIRYFDVQHSINGLDFQNIGRVNAASGTGVLLSNASYQFIHVNPVNGINYYRIKAVGTYGHERLSNIAQINFDVSFLALVFPNPVTDQSVISIFLDKPSTVYIRAFDLVGKLVWRKEELLAQGSNHINLPAAKWSTGIYLLEVSLPSGDKRVLKLMK